MSIAKSLFKIANDLSPYTNSDYPEIDSLTAAAKDVGKSWSGSWLGYHSRIYYQGFIVPPPGARFSQEWGFKNSYLAETKGNWAEFNFENVIAVINKKAGNPNIEAILAQGSGAKEAFEQAKSHVLSLVHSNFGSDRDKFLQSIIDKIESFKVSGESDFIRYFQPSGQTLSRDTVAIEKGRHTPPHIAVLAKALAAKSPFDSCSELKREISKLASHVQNLEDKAVKEERIGTNIFIGHGRSPFWRELKDFVDDRLGLPWDEFNRVPIAGITNINRLEQMLDKASFAFLVMTAEDEQADGNLHARMNVIHEVGLFQGRLGFERAIVLLEEGCAEFSNIQGLGQIRFPKGKISAIFEEVRQVLEREGIVE
jgi:predicted nucleotide-binding protein